jgi:hypothetical protein
VLDGVQQSVLDYMAHCAISPGPSFITLAVEAVGTHSRERHVASPPYVLTKRQACTPARAESLPSLTLISYFFTLSHQQPGWCTSSTCTTLSLLRSCVSMALRQRGCASSCWRRARWDASGLEADCNRPDKETCACSRICWNPQPDCSQTLVLQWRKLLHVCSKCGSCHVHAAGR